MALEGFPPNEDENNKSESQQSLVPENIRALASEEHRRAFKGVCRNVEQEAQQLKKASRSFSDGLNSIRGRLAPVNHMPQNDPTRRITEELYSEARSLFSERQVEEVILDASQLERLEEEFADGVNEFLSRNYENVLQVKKKAGEFEEKLVSRFKALYSRWEDTKGKRKSRFESRPEEYLHRIRSAVHRSAASPESSLGLYYDRARRVLHNELPDAVSGLNRREAAVLENLYNLQKGFRKKVLDPHIELYAKFEAQDKAKQ